LWRVPTGGTLDSIAVDSARNIAAAVIGESAVVVVSPAGELLAVHEVPGNEPVVTNVAFGGADMRTAYITSGGRGSVYEMEWHCPGLALNFNDLNLPCG
jgi:gluconolactonase